MTVAMSAHDLITVVSATETDELLARDEDATGDLLAVAVARMRERLHEEQPWRFEASCRGGNWWGVGYGMGATNDARRRVCASCPVRLECLEDALSVPGIIRDSSPLRAGLSGQELMRAVQWVTHGAGTAREVAEAIVTGELVA